MFEYLTVLLDEKLFVASTLTAAIAYILKVWGESKRDARYVLYLLMDLRKALLGYKLQMDKAGAPAADMIAEHFQKQGVEVSEVDIGEAREALGKLFGDLDSLLFRYKDQLFDDRFENALAELAKRDPLRAYRVRSHQFMVRVTETQDKFFADLVSQKLEDDLKKGEAPEEVRNAVRGAFEEVISEGRISNVESFLKDLNSDLLSLAFSSGPFVFFATVYRLIVSDVKPFMSNFDPSVAEEFMKKVKDRSQGLLLANAIKKYGLRPKI